MIRNLVRAVVGGAAAAVLAADLTFLVAGYRLIDRLPPDWLAIVIAVAAAAGLIGVVLGAKFGATRIPEPAAAICVGVMVGYVAGGLGADSQPAAFDWTARRGRWELSFDDATAYHRAVLTGAFGGAELGGLAGWVVVRWDRRLTRRVADAPAEVDHLGATRNSGTTNGG